MSRKICVVTGSRAEYGLLRWVMEGIRQAPELELQIVVTGMHLSPEFGLTYREIEKDGFFIDRKVETLLSSDTPIGLAKATGLGLISLAEALDQLQPNLMLILGDRFETFSAAAAALFARIPVAHLHGGETSEGVFDEAIRHSITKMSHLHFVAASEYRRRVIQLGEDPDRVYMVGGLGVDGIKRTSLLDRAALERALGFQLGPRSLMVTYHPVTLENVPTVHQVKELLAALDTLKDTQLIFTMPNADTYSRALLEAIQGFVSQHPNAHAYTSLGQQRYLSCLQYVDGVVGNSSSGLTEVPSFGKGTVNIGDRQSGRLKATSVIDCDPNRQSIMEGFKRLYSAEFQASLRTVHNPYGEGGASERIVEILRQRSLEGLVKKRFHDLAH